MTRLLTERLLEAADRVPPLAAHDLRALLEVAADTISRLEEELVASRDEAAQGDEAAVQEGPMQCSACQGKGYRIALLDIMLTCPHCQGSGKCPASPPAEQQPAPDGERLLAYAEDLIRRLREWKTSSHRIQGDQP